ncbi:MAG: uroporphyrinogen-III synthase [Parachlamydiaceae bacterium]
MRRVLYLGLDLPEQQMDHCPLIQIVPRPKSDPNIINAFTKFQAFTHLIFTSKSSVSIVVEYAPHFGIDLEQIRHKCILAVGTQTAAKLASFGIAATITAANETGEGIIDELSKLDLNLKTASVFWPHSSLSRPLISEWLTTRHIPFVSPIFYDTVPRIPTPLPDLALYDELIFTSPSVVDAFVSIYKILPKDKILTSIGPITQKHISSLQDGKSGMIRIT